MRPRCPLCHKDSDLIFDSRGKAISCLCGWTFLDEREHESQQEKTFALIKKNGELEAENRALKESRDKLLEALKDLDSSMYPKHSTEEVFIPATSYHDGYSIRIDKLIEAAEALKTKEKETK